MNRVNLISILLSAFSLGARAELPAANGRTTWEETEKETIRIELERCGWNKAQAASKLP